MQDDQAEDRAIRQKQIEDIRRVHGDKVAEGYMTPAEIAARNHSYDGILNGGSLCEAIGRAQVRKLHAEAAVLEGQAARYHAEAAQTLEAAAMQRFNLEVMAPIQQKMQENTLRLQTVQIDADVAVATAKSQSSKRNTIS